MRTAFKIGVGIFIGGVLLVGACGALLASGVEDDEPEGIEATDVGDRYCSPEREDRLAAMEDDSGETINDPRKLRRYTRRFRRAVNDAPRGAWCADNRVEFLIDVWNGNRGDDRYPEAAEQVRELRKFERR